MKVVHCLGWYWPESVGGTEVYVRDLCRELTRLGVEVAIMAPRDGDRCERYTHAGVPVVRYPVPHERSREQHALAAPPPLFEAFTRELDALHPDVFHMHSITYGCGLPHLRYAHARGVPAVVSVHVPGPLCQRGTMMRFGREPCDGRVAFEQCAPCWLETRGLSPELARVAAAALARMPAGASAFAPGRLRVLLDTRARIERARDRLHELAALSARVVVVSQWLIDALSANGIPREKLLLSRQGFAPVPDSERGPLARAGDAPRALRIGYFGRAARVKGIDLLLAAIRTLDRAVPVELVVRAIANSDEDRAYLRELQQLAAGELRIRFLAPLPSERVTKAMRECDVVAVPSRCLETGPLSAIEALSVGIPVLGSALGGIAELVEPGVNGWLLPCDDVAAWAAQIAALCENGAAALSWDSARTRSPRQAEVAAAMLRVYEQMIA